MMGGRVVGGESVTLLALLPVRWALASDPSLMLCVCVRLNYCSLTKDGDTRLMENKQNKTRKQLSFRAKYM